MAPRTIAGSCTQRRDISLIDHRYSRRYFDENANSTVNEAQNLPMRSNLTRGTIPCRKGASDKRRLDSSLVRGDDNFERPACPVIRLSCRFRSHMVKDRIPESSLHRTSPGSETPRGFSKSKRGGFPVKRVHRTMKEHGSVCEQAKRMQSCHDVAHVAWADMSEAGMIEDSAGRVMLPSAN